MTARRRQVTRVLEHRKDEEERGHDGQHDGDRVRDAHRHETVRADEEGGEEGNPQPGEEGVRPPIQVAAPHARLAAAQVALDRGPVRVAGHRQPAAVNVDARAGVGRVHAVLLGLRDDADARRSVAQHDEPLVAFFRGVDRLERRCLLRRAEVGKGHGAAEDAVLDEVDRRARAEDADDLVGQQQHQGEHGQSPEGMRRGAPERRRRPRVVTVAHADERGEDRDGGRRAQVHGQGRPAVVSQALDQGGAGVRHPAGYERAGELPRAGAHPCVGASQPGRQHPGHGEQYEGRYVPAREETLREDATGDVEEAVLVERIGAPSRGRASQGAVVDDRPQQRPGARDAEGGRPRHVPGVCAGTRRELALLYGAYDRLGTRQAHLAEQREHRSPVGARQRARLLARDEPRSLPHTGLERAADPPLASQQNRGDGAAVHGEWFFDRLRDGGDRGLHVCGEDRRTRERRTGEEGLGARRAGSQIRTHGLQSFALGGGGRIDAHAAKLALERLEIDAQASRTRLVEHVEIEAEGDAQLRDLQGEEQRAREVLRVPDLDERVVRFRQKEVPRDGLVLAHRHEVVRAGGVDDVPGVLAEVRSAARDLDRRARIVADRDVRTRQGAEENTLAHVGLTHE